MRAGAVLDGVPGRAAASRQPRRIVFAVGLALSAWLVFFPTKQLTAEKLRIGRLEARLTEVTRENAAMRADVRRLEDPSELELLARDRLGWVRPGERAYLVVPEPSPKPPPEAPSRTWWSRLAEHLVGLVRGSG